MLEADVVIVGAGVCGALCAWKLASAGKTVLVLEASDHSIDPSQREVFRQVMAANTNRGDMHAPYAALASRRYAPSPETTDKPEKKYYDLAGPEMFGAQYVRLVGGSTWAWRGNTIRFVPNDFQLKSKYHRGENWPIRYNILERWYVEAERELGIAGNDREWNGLLGATRSKKFPMPPIPLSYGDKKVKKVLDNTVIDRKTIKVVSTPQARATRRYRPHQKYFEKRATCKGNSNCIPFCPTGAKYDATAHLRAALNVRKAGTPVVTLKRGCVVTSLKSDAKGRITQVVYRDWRSDNKNREQIAIGKKVILAANAIETTKLLLMSDLANHSDQVGRNLMDHVQDEITALFPEKLYPFRGPQTTCSIENFRDGPFRKKYSAIRMTVGNDGHGRARSPIDIVDEYLENKIFGKKLVNELKEKIPRMLRISYSTEMLPNPYNQVTLSNSKTDELKLPKPRIAFMIGRYTYDGLKKGHDIALQLLKRNVKGKDIEIYPKEERKWSPTWKTAAHIMGTCRMGSDPGTSVVNNYGRAHDNPNLYIVGPSVFTTSATANPTLTAAALALRTADIVSKS